jgi:hypothetical protein
MLPEAQADLLRALACFQDERGLHALLACLAESEDLPYATDKDYGRRWRWHEGGPYPLVEHLLMEVSARAAWRDVIRHLEVDDLPFRERRILDRLSEAVTPTNTTAQLQSQPRD